MKPVSEGIPPKEAVPEATPPTPGQVTSTAGQVNSMAPDKSVRIQFDRTWDWSMCLALIDLVEYERHNGIHATFLNRMDLIPNQISRDELDKLSRRYPAGGGYMTGTIMRQGIILGQRVDDKICYMCNTDHKALTRREVDVFYRGGDISSTCTLDSTVDYKLNMIICAKCVGDRSNNHTSEWMIFSASQSQYVPTTKNEDQTTREEMRVLHSWQGMHAEEQLRNQSQVANAVAYFNSNVPVDPSNSNSGRPQIAAAGAGGEPDPEGSDSDGDPDPARDPDRRRD